MRYLITLLMLLVAPQLYAQSEQQLTITKAGYFLTVVDVSGIPNYVQLTNIVDLTDPSNPTPTPTPTPNPPELDMVLVKDVQDWATEVSDPQGSQAIAIVYLTVRNAGIKSPWPILKQATDEALSIISSDSDWEPFRKNLSAELTERTQRGTLNNITALKSIQQGLEMSADGSIALPVETVGKISDTTKGIIEGATNVPQ